MKNKKIIIIGIVVFVLIMMFIILLVFNKHDKYKIITIDEAIVFNDLKGVKKNNKNLIIADKYGIDNRDLIGTNYAVKLGDSFAKLVLLRSNNISSNIIQVQYFINQDEKAVLSLMSDYIDNFKDVFSHFVDDMKLVEEKLYGESKYKFSMPIEESIYVEKRLYSMVYESPGSAAVKRKYDMNFYMNGEYLVCEFVKFMK